MSEIKIIREPITRAELKKIAKERFGDMVKVAVDIEQEIIAIGGEFHMDESNILYEESNSKWPNTWGINIYPDKTGEGFVEFDSMINLKPNEGNRSRDIEDQNIKNKILEIVCKLIK